MSAESRRGLELELQAATSPAWVLGRVTNTLKCCAIFADATHLHVNDIGSGYGQILSPSLFPKSCTLMAIGTPPTSECRLCAGQVGSVERTGMLVHCDHSGPGSKLLGTLRDTIRIMVLC